MTQFFAYISANMVAGATAMNDMEGLEQPVETTLSWLSHNINDLVLGSLVAIGITGLMLIVRALGRSYRRKTKDRTSWKGIIAGVFAKTGILFMLVTAFYIVVSYTAVPANIERAFNFAFTVVAALQGAIWARELILGVVKSKAIANEEEGDRESTLTNALSLIRVLVNIAAFAIAFIVILDNLGVNVTTLIAGLGIGGIAIGLAAQGIFSDLFAALSIVFDRPFRKGDTINYGGTTGTVEKIGLKTTRLRAVDGQQIIMSNTKLLENEVNNYAMAERRRVTIPFGVIYQTPPGKLKRMKAIVESAIKPFDNIQTVRTVCDKFGDSSIDFIFIYDQYTTDYEELVGTKSQVLIRIAELFAEEGIEFAYPTQTTFTAAPDGEMIMPYPSDLKAALANPASNG